MKPRILFFLLFLTTFFAKAQYTIEGSLTQNTKGYKWAILYQVKEGRQFYIKNTKIKDNTFSFELPAKAHQGMYRVVYSLKEGAHLDFLFNKENVAFSFDPNYAEGTVVFSVSEENKLYQSYLSVIMEQQQKIDSLQAVHFKKSDLKHNSLYTEVLASLNSLQAGYEEKSKGTLAYHFIKATKRYNSVTIVEEPQVYLKNVKENFFRYINFNDTVLQSSSFLADRIVDYVFYINYSEDKDIQQQIYKESVSKVLESANRLELRKDLTEVLIEEFVKYEDEEMLLYLFEKYYDTLPEIQKREGYKENVLDRIAVTIGKVAPEITWEEAGVSHKLSELNTHKNYLLVFWSSGCSHCRAQLPEIYTFLADKKDIQVVAIALEKSPKGWEILKPNFKGWIHVLKLNKWENEIVETYDISATPTYILLNEHKVILDKPSGFENLKESINSLK